VRRATGRVASRVQTFADRYPWLGPGVMNLSVVYFVVQAMVAAVWHPPYDWGRNTISDLGNSSCAVRGTTAPACAKEFSPLHDWMNAEFIFLGAVMLVGSLLIAQEFRILGPGAKRAWAWAGFALIGVGGVGSALVGWFPENTVGAVHFFGAALAIGGGELGISILGWKLSLPRYLQWAMRIGAPLAFLAGFLFAVQVHLGLGAGTMERIAQYPETVWLIVFGAYMSDNHYKRLRNPAFPHDPRPAPPA